MPVPAFVITNPLPEIPPATLRTLVPPTVHDWFAVRAIGRPESKVAAPAPPLATVTPPDPMLRVELFDDETT